MTVRFAHPGGAIGQARRGASIGVGARSRAGRTVAAGEPRTDATRKRTPTAHSLRGTPKVALRRVAGRPTSGARTKAMTNRPIRPAAATDCAGRTPVGLERRPRPAAASLNDHSGHAFG